MQETTPRTYKLGIYAEALLQSLFELIKHPTLIGHHIPVPDTKGKTLGEIDFVLAETDFSKSCLVEFAVKFYCLDLNLENLKELDAEKGMYHWIGPKAVDSLGRKLESAFRFLETQSGVEATLNALSTRIEDFTANSLLPERKLWIKGRVFVGFLDFVLYGSKLRELVLDCAPYFASTVELGLWIRWNEKEKLGFKKLCNQSRFRISSKENFLTGEPHAPSLSYDELVETLNQHFSSSEDEQMIECLGFEYSWIYVLKPSWPH